MSITTSQNDLEKIKHSSNEYECFDEQYYSQQFPKIIPATSPRIEIFSLAENCFMLKL